MKTILVNELTKEQLDFFAAKAQDPSAMIGRSGHPNCTINGINYGIIRMVIYSDYSPTSDTQAGKAQLVDLIVKFKISSAYYDWQHGNEPYWAAAVKGDPIISGPTYHLAITRAVVASVFGSEVEVEDEWN